MKQMSIGLAVLVVGFSLAFTALADDGGGFYNKDGDWVEDAFIDTGDRCVAVNEAMYQQMVMESETLQVQEKNMRRTIWQQTARAPGLWRKARAVAIVRPYAEQSLLRPRARFDLTEIASEIIANKTSETATHRAVYTFSIAPNHRGWLEVTPIVAPSLAETAIGDFASRLAEKAAEESEVWYVELLSEPIV